jgi:hypothetical protein
MALNLFVFVNHHPLKTNFKKGDTFLLNCYILPTQRHLYVTGHLWRDVTSLVYTRYVCCRGIFLTPDEDTVVLKRRVGKI